MKSFGIWGGGLSSGTITELEFCTPRLENLAGDVFLKSQEHCLSNETRRRGLLTLKSHGQC